MGEVFVITSGKGGVGKSTVAVGLAAAFCRAGKRTLLVDADEGLRCLDGMLGVSSDVFLDVGDALDDAERLASAAVAIDSVPGLCLLAAPMNFGGLIAERYGETVRLAASVFDIVILDCPAGVDDKYYRSLPKDSHILVVTNSDAAAVSGAAQAGILVRKNGFSDLHLIVNKFLRKQVGHLHSDVNRMVDQTGISLIGVVPLDPEIVKATAKGHPSERGRAMMAFSRIAARLLGERILLPSVRRI